MTIVEKGFAIPENVVIMNKKEDSDYPYTYACDFILIISPWDEIGCGMERAEGRYILKMLSMALGVSDKELAEKLADAYLKYDFQVHLLKDNPEEFEFPENAIGCKVIINDEIKWVYWLEPKNKHAKSSSLSIGIVDHD